MHAQCTFRATRVRTMNAIAVTQTHFDYAATTTVTAVVCTNALCASALQVGSSHTHTQTRAWKGLKYPFFFPSLPIVCGAVAAGAAVAFEATKWCPTSNAKP